MDYWTECIESSFEEAGIEATKEQIQMVAGDVEVSSDNYGMAHGHDAIPNPRDEDVRRLNAQIKQVEKERDQMTLNFKQNVATRRGCDVSDVSIDQYGCAVIR